MSNCEGNVYHIGMGCCVPKIANPDLYYTKEEVDEKIDDIEVSGITEEKAQEIIDESLESYYTKTEVDGLASDLEAADSVLGGRVDTLTTNLETEVQRAQNTETQINENVSILSGNVTDLGEAIETIEGELAVDVASKEWVSGYTYDKQTIEDMIEEGGGFIPENYYDKVATDALLANKANTATTYTKTEVNNAISAATSEKVDSSVVDSLSDYVDTINEDVETVSGDVSAIETTLDTYFDESARVSEFDYITNDDYIELQFPYYKNQGDGWDNENNIVQIDAATESSAGVMSASDKEKLNGLLKTWSGTQAEYDAITEKDNNTVYFIKED